MWMLERPIRVLPGILCEGIRDRVLIPMRNRRGEDEMVSVMESKLGQRLRAPEKSEV